MTSTSRSPRRKRRPQTGTRATVSRSVADQRFARITFKGDPAPDYSAYAEWYCTAVVQGVVMACRWERLGCQRFLHMLQEARKPRSEFIYSSDRVTDACAFQETLPHIKGFHGTIVLEPVQCWWIAAIFGFRERDTGRRWVREVAFWIPRKNAKTALAVGIVFYCVNFENEPGAEGCIAAGSEKQADIPFLAMRQTLDKEPELRAWLLAKDTTEFIKFRRTGAEIKLLAGRAPNLDGLNPHVVLAEEVHAQNQDVIGVLKSAQGARLQPLWLGISTAGRNASGPAYDGWKSDQQVLEGKMRADRVFIAMYAADREDEERRFDPIVVEKLNPLYGVSLNPTSLETEEREARKSEAKLQEYKRTRLNIWSRAAGNLFSVEQWDACADPKLSLDALKGFPMFVGLDLASHSDLNAACFLICVEDVLYATFRYWVPERSARFQDDRYADQFAAWKRDGFLITTKGSHVHHPTIRNDVLAMVRGHNVAGFAFDQHQADYLMGEVEAEGYTAYIVPKVARHITRSTDDLVTRHIEPERFQHDGNPISSWCAGNVVAHRDANDNVLPKKEQRGSKQSIDGMDALITANAARLAAEAGMIDGGVKVQKPDVYMERGLIGFS